jgi:hypothetical protein
MTTQLPELAAQITELLRKARKRGSGPSALICSRVANTYSKLGGIFCPTTSS